MRWADYRQLEKDLFELPDDPESVLDAQFRERLARTLDRVRRDCQPWDWSEMDREPFDESTRAFARRMISEED